MPYGTPLKISNLNSSTFPPSTPTCTLKTADVFLRCTTPYCSALYVTATTILKKKKKYVLTLTIVIVCQ